MEGMTRIAGRKAVPVSAETFMIKIVKIETIKNRCVLWVVEASRNI
jgi:hypothetical protein